MKKHVQILIAVGLLLASISYLLAVWVAPWFYAINTRVRLKMEAPAETKIDICWDERQIECLPLVPYSEENNRLAKAGEVANMWLGELPPRPVYFVSLIFNSSVSGMHFHELELTSITNGIGVLPGAGVGNIIVSADQFAFQGVTHHLNQGVFDLESGIEGKLILIKEIKPQNSDVFWIGRTTLKVWILILSIFPLLIIPICLLPRMIGNFGNASNKSRPHKVPWWEVLLGGVVAGFMLFLIANSPVNLNPFDPMSYLKLATGGGWFNDTRLPAYPLFLGLALEVSGYHLNAVILFQAGLLVTSTFLCIWMLGRLMHPVAAVLFIFLCLLSPAQVYYARWILRDSLFSSLVLLGMAALIAHFTSRRPFSIIWIVVYGLISAVAFLVRENALLFLVILIPVLILKFLKLWMSPQKIWARLRSVVGMFFPYSIPLLAIGIVYLGFSSYNYLHFGYFQVEILPTVYNYVGKTMLATNFDPRGLLYPVGSMDNEAETYLGLPIYNSYILTRDQSPLLDPLYAGLIPFLNQAMISRGEASNSFHLASILDEIGRNSYHLVPRQADIAGLLRQYKALISMDIGVYSMDPDDPLTLANKQGWLSKVSGRISYEGKLPDPRGIISRYYRFTQGYSWYGLLFILALLSSLYIILFEDPIFLVPIAFFIANDFFLIYSHFVYRRYVVVLDVLLVLQIVMGLSLWMNKRNFLKKRAD